ncbi:C40 family peptidase [Sporosarcina thermotolerans]|uniref:C40 family peptidase n=1 Tax=Sporosarcina thermotolerans TaxID=633404 RepID=UPI00360E6416
MRKHYIIFFLVFLFLFTNTPNSYAAGNFCFKANNTNKHIVNVAVTTLWAAPNSTRKVDNPSISKPVDLSSWTKNMNYEQKLGLLGKIETQALYGQEVTVLENRGNWYKIAVTEQASPKNSKGYPGWVPKSHITETYSNYEECDIAIVTANKSHLYNTTFRNSKFLEISFNTILPVLKVEDNWIQVQTPQHGIMFIQKQDVKVFSNYKNIPKPTQQDLIDTAKRFLELPYLWAGVSAYGFDCSGFTYSVYKQHGILIPRDSSVQAKQGEAVSKNNLQAGDLLFFAHNKGKGAVHHVAMYIGNGQMIHSPNYSRSLEIISINTAPYKSEYAGATRYLK